ncbi:cytochrome P450 3A9-like [Brachionus plicatilis]|uniref:Cytochrome P450 3A9-like n=1 Tax=Brachionus plicatilis TaxID=10195 RepID=A0A3M7SAB3_BRAPC|nr:cytochrome P450 3A9-like [Brachionus plicatilis]
MILSKFKLPKDLLDFWFDLKKEIFSNKKNASLILSGTISLLVLLNFFFKFITKILSLKNWYNQVKFFKKCNIPGPRPWTLLGSMHEVLRYGFAKNDRKLIDKYGAIVGYFEGSTPVVVTTDLKFIKNVMVKDFNCFVNRRTFDSLAVEPTDKFLTSLKDDKWKNVRTIVTTAFTSGKLKSMSKHINDCSNSVEKYVDKLADHDGILDTKKIFSCLTLDVISSCCFGVSINSICNPENEFNNHLQRIFQNFQNFSKPIFFPNIAAILSKRKLIELFPSDGFRFFKNFTDIIKRDDFIQTMLDFEENNSSIDILVRELELQNDTKLLKWNADFKKTLTNHEILSQSILFLLAGYETTAHTLCFISYCLAMNPKYQDKLCNEIDTVLDYYDGKISYESVSEMKYMDNVIDETLRLFPSVIRLDRVASQDYEYNGTVVKKGVVWSLPIWALHHDPEIYPGPYEFRPERFDEQEKKKETI